MLYGKKKNATHPVGKFEAKYRKQNYDKQNKSIKAKLKKMPSNPECLILKSIFM